MILVVWCGLMFASVLFLNSDTYLIVWFILNFAAFVFTLSIKTLKSTKPDGYLFLFESGKTPILRIDNELPRVGGELIIAVEDGDHADIPDDIEMKDIDIM